MSELVRLDVGGTSFKTYRSTLSSVPDSRLASLKPTDDEYNSDGAFYFFDRNADLFPYILDLYRTGELHLPKHVCAASVRKELEFWGISEDKISECCFSGISQHEDDTEVIEKLRNSFENKGIVYTDEQLRTSARCRWMNCVWEFLNNPRSSKLAMGFTIFYFSLVFLSILVFIIHTHPDARYRLGPEAYNVPYENMTLSLSVDDYLLEEFDGVQLMVMYYTTDQFKALYYLEKICFGFFVVELVVRFIVCPRRLRFFLDVFNIIDLLIIISTTFTIIIEERSTIDKDNESLFWTFIICKGCIVFRVLRTLKLTKYYSGLRVLVLAIRASVKELLLLSLSFFIAASLFASLIYYAEFHFNGGLSNIPLAVWWAIVTMTTVGYGDFYPSSLPGYIIGSMCAMCGILILAMPIAIIATNFNDYYTRNKVRERQTELREKNKNPSASIQRISSRVDCSNRTSETSVSCEEADDTCIKFTAVTPVNETDKI